MSNRMLLNKILGLERGIQIQLNKEPFDVQDEINQAKIRHDYEWEQLQLIWKLGELADDVEVKK